MESSVLIFRGLGVLLILVGFVVSANPELIIQKPVPIDVFEAVERRVWWGLIIGIGLLLMFHHQVQPWLLTLAAAGVALTSGILVARFIGIVLDGSHPKQWFWVVVELLIIVGFAFWYWKQKQSV